MQTYKRGFSLIELMIAVAVVGILSSIALPSYHRYLTRTYRAQAAAALFQDAQFLERYLSQNNRYDRDSLGNKVNLPMNATDFYTISAEYSADGTEFQLIATPKADSALNGDDCGALYLNQFGQKTQSNSELSNSDCWR
jgi:type IV pilus assembly protein PilE